MKQAILAGLLGLGTASLVMSCASSDPGGSSSEGIGAVSQEVITKCEGQTNFATSYCQPDCKCDYGEGDCDSDADCGVHPTLGQLACSGVILNFGGTVKGEVCAPPHCDNLVKDGNETQVDCGGECGLVCPDQCAGLPANGTAGHCTTTCPCTSGHGACDENDAECFPNTFCASNVGNYFGFSNTTDVCLAETCRNNIQDPDEENVDCGGGCLPCALSGTLAFAKGGGSNDRSQDVAIDSAGTITIAGSFSGSANFGGGTLTASGGSDVFVAKYNNVGAHSWSKRIGGSLADGDLNVAVAVDATRAIYVAGNYRGTIDLGGATHTAVSNSDAFIAKYNPSGVLIWSKSYGSPAFATTINALEVGPTGHLYVAGAFASSTITFGGAPLVNQGPAGTWDGFALKLSSAGAHAWSSSFGSVNNDQATGIAVDASSRPYVSGYFFGTVLGMTSLGNQEGCLLQLSTSNGAMTWARRLGGTQADSATSVAVDANGPVVGGYFRGSMTFDDASIATTATYAAFIAAYDASGTFRWKNAYPSTDGRSRTNAMASASTGVVALGEFAGTTTFASGPVTALGGGTNGWMVRYNTAGGAGKELTFGNPTALPYGATVTDGLLGITGAFQGSVDFHIEGQAPLSSVGGQDAFFARLVY